MSASARPYDLSNKDGSDWVSLSDVSLSDVDQKKPRTIIIAAASFVGGFLLHLVWSHCVPADPNVDIARHWKRVNDYNPYIRNPDSYNIEPSGLYGAIVPYDPEPSLAALVAARKLQHIDIVLPLVSRNDETSRFGMQFVEGHANTIIYATANPEFQDFQPSGPQQMHFTLWIKENGRRDVQRLISELEALSAKDEQPGT